MLNMKRFQLEQIAGVLFRNFQLTAFQIMDREKPVPTTQIPFWLNLLTFWSFLFLQKVLPNQAVKNMDNASYYYFFFNQ